MSAHNSIALRCRGRELFFSPAFSQDASDRLRAAYEVLMDAPHPDHLQVSTPCSLPMSLRLAAPRRRLISSSLPPSFVSGGCTASLLSAAPQRQA